MNYSNSPFTHVVSPQISLSYDEISSRAYELWQRGGFPIGRDQEIWLRAEQELREKHRVSDTASAPPRETAPDKEMRQQALRQRARP